VILLAVARCVLAGHESAGRCPNTKPTKTGGKIEALWDDQARRAAPPRWSCAGAPDEASAANRLEPGAGLEASAGSVETRPAQPAVAGSQIGWPAAKRPRLVGLLVLIAFRVNVRSAWRSGPDGPSALPVLVARAASAPTA